MKGGGTDDWSVVLTVIGSGTLLPSAERGSASFHVRAGGHALLVDAGSGTLHGLPRAGLDWRAVETIVVSHFHPDHVTDLPALLAAYRFVGSEEPLTLVGPVGIRDFMDRLVDLYGPWIWEPSRPVDVVEIEPGDAWWSDDGAVGIEATPTPHTDESVAYRITCRPDAWGPDGPDGGGPDTDTAPSARIGYTGDTGPSVELHDFLRGCDVLVAECALSDPPEIDTHLSPRSVVELALATRPELLLVSHVYPPQTPGEAVEEVVRRYRGRVEPARDGLRVRIGVDGAVLEDGAVTR